MPAQEYNNTPLTAVTTTSTKEKRSQPWKTHWPPQKNIPDQKAYGFAKGETVAIYGN
ncbi:hypothetical protein TSTA_015980 [Talaromyces stipitatus ATCC 10500]|uniref:Uncharacterized protein n=1 Tax=Talaromyces stipitatus (strain ATCC 10500 / CBS 375.48 / QM 6759 / NRRL 1006) TaxID=441959 RepID=B8ME89_TALSN|nr:uncharacterized protein TSTA_015980 [Talaromyces stipitatus ATCC 10500]XP_002483751.1 uncharacterized protein TSTA_015980 [Talaromyces stipitatus ATCC 10500]EED16516.1 hypothetical protein TSTA_015980 [Talaromyces stipitatus ATCC 10500]EED16517.1 hypothetical protein TSTA_015980 [Talaromyces stipitatus ATCC 10500]